MARMFGYIIVLSMLSLVLVFGTNEFQTTSASILTDTGLLTEPQNFLRSNFVSLFWDQDNPTKGFLLIGIVSATVIVGLFTRQPIESFLVLPLAGFLFLWVGDLIAIMQHVTNSATPNSWVYYLIILIYIPLIIGYVISVVDWWRGKD